jgi:hypothetical protein
MVWSSLDRKLLNFVAVQQSHGFTQNAKETFNILYKGTWYMCGGTLYQDINGY